MLKGRLWGGWLLLGCRPLGCRSLGCRSLLSDWLLLRGRSLRRRGSRCRRARLADGFGRIQAAQDVSVKHQSHLVKSVDETERAQDGGDAADQGHDVDKHVHDGLRFAEEADHVHEVHDEGDCGYV